MREPERQGKRTEKGSYMLTGEQLDDGNERERASRAEVEQLFRDDRSRREEAPAPVRRTG
jgi:hypothetical protein